MEGGNVDPHFYRTNQGAFDVNLDGILSKKEEKNGLRNRTILNNRLISLYLLMLRRYFQLTLCVHLRHIFDSDCHCFPCHCTKMYPIPLMCCSPLSGEYFAWLPHVLELSGFPPVPKPILESQEEHLFSLLAMKPILAFEEPWTLHTALNPSLLQLCCREAWEPISDFQLFRPADVLRYCPSAISECNEFAR